MKKAVLVSVISVLTVITVVSVAFFGFIALIFWNFGQTTVVQTVESPDGAYYAEVIDIDQGALGGDTVVDVYEKVFLNISKKSQRVYHGDWGEFRNMEIYWKDEHCLVINSTEYLIE